MIIITKTTTRIGGGMKRHKNKNYHYYKIKKTHPITTREKVKKGKEKNVIQFIV